MDFLCTVLTVGEHLTAYCDNEEHYNVDSE